MPNYNTRPSFNTLETADLFQTTLDKLAVREAVTGWMEANAGKVKYTGGDEVKIPKMSVQGLADYDRKNGYTLGAVDLQYETFKMTQDRGRRFQFDAMEVDESAFIVTAASAMGEFQRAWVLPEIDAYRLSAIATKAIAGADSANMVKYGEVITANTTSLATMRAIKTGIKKIREKGYNGPLVIHANDDTIMELEIELAGKLQSMTWSQGGIDTKVPAIDGVPLIATPSNRMYTSIKIQDGKTEGQEAGGFTKGTSAQSINFMILPRTTPVAVSKQDKTRIFTPDTYQQANAWSVDYRRFHDIWVMDNQVGSIYVSIKEEKTA